MAALLVPSATSSRVGLEFRGLTNKPEIKPQETGSNTSRAFLCLMADAHAGVGAGRVIMFGCDYGTVWSFRTHLQLWIKLFGSNLCAMDLEPVFLFFFESLAVVAFVVRMNEFFFSFHFAPCLLFSLWLMFPEHFCLFVVGHQIYARLCEFHPFVFCVLFCFSLLVPVIYFPPFKQYFLHLSNA